MIGCGELQRERVFRARSLGCSVRSVFFPEFSNPSSGSSEDVEAQANHCTKVLIGTIRDEIASCSEKAYPSLPIANAKNLLFLESEGSVVEFAQRRGWVAKDGRIYFPQQQEDARTEDILVASGQVIENTIGYARELETIV